MSKVFFDKIPVPDVNDEMNSLFGKLISSIQNAVVRQIDKEKQIDDLIFDIYNLSKEERRQIGFYEIT